MYVNTGTGPETMPVIQAPAEGSTTVPITIPKILLENTAVRLVWYKLY